MAHKDVAQEWVNQDKESGGGRNSSLTFIGPVLFSYATPIALIDRAQQVVFYSTYSYSMTTSSKHYTARNRAIPWGFLQVPVEEVAKQYGCSATYTPAEMLQSAAQRLIDELSIMSRKRDFSWCISNYNEDREKLLAAFQRYDETPPHIPEVSDIGMLFPNPKAAVLRALQEVKP